MAISETEIFDIWSIVSNELVGDVWLTIFIFVIGTIFLAIKFKMPFELQMMFIVLMLGALFAKTLMPIIWVFVVLFVGMISYWYISKALS